ncbi:MAG: Hsp20/alpha crystallin family protein [Phycisphaerales bacterium]
MLARFLHDSPLARVSREIARDMARDMNSVFDFPMAAPAFAARPFASGPIAGAGVPTLNVWRTDDALHAEAELPGYRMDDIEILATEDTLTLRGTRQITTPENASVLRAERAVGAFERTISLPVAIDMDRVGATLRDGVLHITLPLAAEVRPRRVSIQVQDQAPRRGQIEATTNTDAQPNA